MARANTKTLLSLDRFAAVLNIMPIHFNQVFLRDLPAQQDGTTARTCDVPIFQFSWQQSGRIGREDIAGAIAAAESAIIAQLGFLPAVDWTEQVERRTIRPANPILYSLNDLDVRAMFKTVKADKGYLITGGQRASTLIAAATAITYSDLDGDGYSERAQISVATTVTDPEELAVFYPGHAGDPAWQIRPLSYVSIAGGVATIRFAREQAIVESAMLGYFPTGLSGTDNANFLTTVDVYRVYNDPSIQSRFIWDTVGGAFCSCDGLSSCEICGYVIQNGCLVVRDPRQGIVSPQPGKWNAATSEFTSDTFSEPREFDRVQLWYKSGWRNNNLLYPNIMMDPMFERAIAYYALTFLDRPMCNCQPLESSFERWRQDLAMAVSSPQGSTSFRTSRLLLDNPLGTTRGAVFAWDVVRNYMLGQSMGDI